MINTDWAKVVCLDLGYVGVEHLSYVGESNTLPGSLDVTLMNPSCDVTTAKSMLQCGSLYDVDECTSDQQIYIRCVGTNLDETECPIKLMIVLRMYMRLIRIGS